jgi:hypothetical protein
MQQKGLEPELVRVCLSSLRSISGLFSNKAVAAIYAHTRCMPRLRGHLRRIIKGVRLVSECPKGFQGARWAVEPNPSGSVSATPSQSLCIPSHASYHPQTIQHMSHRTSFADPADHQDPQGYCNTRLVREIARS